MIVRDNANIYVPSLPHILAGLGGPVVPPPPVICERKNGDVRQITYDDVLKDFDFMANKGFD